MMTNNVGDDRSLEHLYSHHYVAYSNVEQKIVDTVCEICGGHQARQLYRLTETKFSLVVCETCHISSLYPMPTEEEITTFYSAGYYGSSGKKFTRLIESLVRIVGARHARFLAKQVNFRGRVLDVGCGRGVTLRALHKLGMEAYGFEVSSAAIEGLEAEIQTRVDKSLIHANYPSEYFDEVVIWHVLEHLPNPRRIVNEINRILNQNGIVIIAVPNASSWQARWAREAWFHLDPPRHLYQFPVSALEKLLKSNGFDVLSQHHFSLRQNPFGWIQSLLNKIYFLPYNGLYYLLHRKKLSENQTKPFSALTRFVLYAFFVLLAPIALTLSIIAALFRQGATVHIVAQKKPNKPAEMITDLTDQ